MNSSIYVTFDNERRFDSSYNLDHDIKWPQVDSYPLEHSPFSPMSVKSNVSGNNHTFEREAQGAEKLKQFKFPVSPRRSSTEDYYPLKYSDQLSFMNQCDLEGFANIEQELYRYREIAAMERELLAASMMHDKGEVFVPTDLIQDSGETNLMAMFSKQLQEIELLEDVAPYIEKATEESSYHFNPQCQNLVDEYLNGLGVKRTYNMDTDNLELSKKQQNRNKRLCRHFLKGGCWRGKTCYFLHDPSIFCPDSQKVVLGGLPAHITEVTLRHKLAHYGYKVINKPMLLRGFTPQVCMASVEEAQDLIQRGNILIDGSLVDVRAYDAFEMGGIDATSDMWNSSRIKHADKDEESTH